MSGISHSVLSLRDFKLRAALNFRVQPTVKLFNLRGAFDDNTTRTTYFVGDPDGVDAYSVNTSDLLRFTEIINPKNFGLHDVTGDPAATLYVACGVADGADAYLLSRGGAGVWIERANPRNLALTACAFGAGIFVCGGFPDGTDSYLISSTDAITWTERTNPKNVLLEGAAFGNGVFVVVGRADGTDAYIITSPDGITWTERANPKNLNLFSVAWSADHGLFIAGGVSEATDAYLITSPDGITWTERANPFNTGNSAAISGIGAGGGVVLLGIISTLTGQPAFAASLDGVNYFETRFHAQVGLNTMKKIIYVARNNQFVVCVDPTANRGELLVSQSVV